MDSGDDYLCDMNNLSNNKKDIYILWTYFESSKCVGYNECKTLLSLCLKNENETCINNISASKLRSLVISIWSNIPSSKPKRSFIKLIFNWINNKKDDLHKKKNLFYLLKSEKKNNKNLSKICFNYFLNYLIKYKDNCSNDIIYILYLIDENELKIYSKNFIQNHKINFNQFISIWNIMCILFWDTDEINNFTFLQKNKYYYYDFMLIFLKTFYDYINVNRDMREIMKMKLKKTFLTGYHHDVEEPSQEHMSLYQEKNNIHNQDNRLSFTYMKKMSLSNSSINNKQDKHEDQNEYLNLFDIENIINNFNFTDFVNNEISRDNYFDSFFGATNMPIPSMSNISLAGEFMRKNINI
ncbi:hypothetical protein PFMALIP_00029 [Plasmodium falciparum MaliPS096_E11]|nr:hypothetical protein PFMALIP_00029 [Plasmodium falciparum MaliPS096_E11]